MHLTNSMLRGILTPLMTQVFPKVDSSLIEKLIEGFHTYFPGYQITTAKRIAAFIAQAGHETGGFKWFYELGGKRYFNKYEPGTSIGKRLGNTQTGDGYRFRGRGIFHLTGRYNYQKYSALLDLDLVHNPDIAADPIIACLIACEYWKQTGLNPLADVGDLRAITKRINGGYNGWEDRLRYYNLLTDGLNLIDQDIEIPSTTEKIPSIDGHSRPSIGRQIISLIKTFFKSLISTFIKKLIKILTKL
ncbi:MAG: glycoside hydrolase family 19 protein [Candidatus Aquirickettsiella sp.]